MLRSPGGGMPCHCAELSGVEPYRDLATYRGLSGFEGAVGKVARVRYQLRELSERFRAFAESHPYLLREEIGSPSAGGLCEYSFVVDSVSLPKREWGVLIGEIVHNLRSALDHAVYAAAAEPSGTTQFPIVRKREDWPSRLAVQLRSVPDQIVEQVERVQPFHAEPPSTPERHLLAILNRLSNMDKHRLLHTAALTLEGVLPRFEVGSDIAFAEQKDVFTGRLEDGTVLARLMVLPSGPNPTMKMHGEFELNVVFTDPTRLGSVIEGADVLGLLAAIWRLVSDVVIRMEFTCGSESGAEPT